MTPLLHPELVNGRFDDPALYVDCMFARRALLFDLGDLHALPPRKLLRVSDVFVSHMHMDHFIGFDQLLRVLVGREKTVRVFGPAGTIDCVGHRLAGYTWNLAERYATELTFVVTEVLSASEGREATFRFRNQFRREAEAARFLTDGVIRDEDGFRVRAAVLDHRTPCLAYAVEEPVHVNVWKDRLDRLGLPVGRWLRAAKQAILSNQPDETPIRIDIRGQPLEDARTLPLGLLKQEVLRIVPGQKIGYVVDVGYAPENVSRIVDLVAGADMLFIEAVFAAADAAHAADRAHLTTAQAGEIARRAGVKRIVPFHFSPRYAGESERLVREVAEAFGAAVN